MRENFKIWKMREEEEEWKRWRAQRREGELEGEGGRI